MVFAFLYLNKLNEQLKIEFDSNTRLEKQSQDMQKTCAQLERAHNEINDKYQELSAIKLQIEKDFQNQQSTIEHEKNAKLMALDKIQQLEGKIKNIVHVIYSLRQFEIQISSISVEDLTR